MTFLILLIIITIAISFTCSTMETSLISLSETDINILAKNKIKVADKLRELKSDINQPLAAILTLNTIANTFGATAIGAQALSVFGDEWMALFSAVLTFAVLFFAEIIPKTIGSYYYRELAPIVSYVIPFMMLITYPVVWFSEQITSLIPEKKSESKQMQRAVVLAAAEIGEDQGAIKEQEGEVIKNLINLQNLRVKDIMTNRANIFSLQKDTTVEELMKSNQLVRFSRIPLFKEDLDDIVGIVHRYNILDAYVKNKHNTKIEDLSSAFYSVSEHLNVSQVLDLFVRLKQHVFLVINEYGSTSGLVTLEDSIETLLGVDIVDEFDYEDKFHHRLHVDKNHPNIIHIKRSDKSKA